MPARPDVDETTVGVDLDALHQTAWRPMVRLASLLVDDVALAEDVVQDAFLGLHRRAASVRDVEAARAYLRVAVVNGARSTLRRRRTVRTFLRTVRLEHDAPADHDLLLAERDAAVRAALEALPSRQREVVVLRYWEGLSEAQIASLLEIPAGTVKSSASRALRWESCDDRAESGPRARGRGGVRAAGAARRPGRRPGAAAAVAGQ